MRDLHSGRTVFWPEALSHACVAPTTPIWAGANDQYVVILRLRES